LSLLIAVKTGLEGMFNMWILVVEYGARRRRTERVLKGTEEGNQQDGVRVLTFDEHVLY